MTTRSKPCFVRAAARDVTLGYSLRELLAWPGRPFSGESHDVLAAPPTPRGRELFTRYALDERFAAVPMSRETRIEVLGTLDLLDRLPGPTLLSLAHRPRLRVLDVGAKNWRYLGALSAWLRVRFAAAARIDGDGVEVDAYRLYPDLRTRISYGRYFAESHTDQRARFTFHAGDIRAWRAPADIVTWLFPFVSRSPHQAWGLPSRLFDPEGAFAHVRGELLLPHSRLVVANQGEWEWNETERLLQATGAHRLHREIVEGSLHASAYPVHLSVWTRGD